jgi:toxin ParE1/3/4
VNRVVLAPRAIADLEDIWDYTAKHWSDEQAERYVRQIQAAIESLAADPRIGRRCDDIRTGYRRLSVGSHVLFYRVNSDEIDLVRILHGRMDFDSRL